MVPCGSPPVTRVSRSPLRWEKRSAWGGGCHAYQTLYKVTHRYNWNHTDSSWLEMRTGWPYGWFWKFLNGFAKSPRWSPWTLTECNLSWKIVKYCILSEVCMINSTVSPQMWCIKSIKGWFTHPQTGPASWWIIRRELMQPVKEWWVARSWIFQILRQDLEFSKSCWQDFEFSKCCRQDIEFSKSCRQDLEFS